MVQGYFLLAYHLHNYAAACKVCNSTFKRDFFPIASNRISGKRDPNEYALENAYLPYPLGTDDEDPQKLIGFVGAEAVPRFTQNQDLKNHRRACVMIDFFGLNRDGLVTDRAWWLLNAVWANVQSADAGNLDALKRLEVMQSKKSPFTNCTQCFIELCQSQRPLAAAMIPVFEQMTVDNQD